jgi:HK97 family phage prohead protease
MTLIRKTAAGKMDGSLLYVLSDATVDRLGDIIEPSGWLLDSFQRNPIALFNHSVNQPIGRWANIRVEDERLVADFVPAAAGTSQRTDEINSLIKQNILRATSVGFRGLERELIDPKRPGSGTRFTRQELLETSIVSVPANPAALQIAKSLGISDDTMSEAFREHAAMGRTVVKSNGEYAVMKPARRGISMNISQQVQDVQNRLNQARDALTEYLGEDQQDPVQRDAMSTDIQAIEAELRSLENAERALAPRGPQQQVAATTITAPAIRRPLAVQKAPEPLDYWARAGAIALHAYCTRRSLEDVTKQGYPDDEQTAWYARAAQPGALTTFPTWAAELVQTKPLAFLEQRSPSRILTTLSGLGTTLPFDANGGIIRIPSTAATPSIAGSFVGEAQPIPVRRMGFTSIELRRHKVGVITRYSREVAELSSPAIEPIVRSEIIRTTNIVLDTLLIDAVALSATRPAGLLNGVTPLTATAGGGYGAILGDIGKLTTPFYTVNAGASLAMLVNPAQRRALSMTPGPGNMGIGWTTELMSTFTVIESTVVPAGTVIVVEAEDFVSAIGAPEFMVSEEATLHIEDTTPANIGVAGAPAVLAGPVESMYQTNQLALRLVMPVTWAMRRTGMVQTMSSVNWAPA